MPSPDNRANSVDAFDTDERHVSFRAVFEWTMRGIALVTLAFAIWLAFHALRRTRDERAEGAGIREALASWSTREAPEAAHVVFDSVPTPDLRDWIAALSLAKTKTSWEGTTLRPSGLSVEPVADPTGPSRIWVAAPPKSTVVLRDSAGIIDSVVVQNGGAVMVVPRVIGTVQATVNGTTASTVRRDSLSVKSVLMIGVAGWEAKFITMSLEEYGWKVDGMYGLVPKGSVTLGPASPQIDTAHYSLVIAVDTAAGKYAGAIEKFVRSGGGFIAVGEGAATSAFSSFLPGSVGASTQPSSFSVDTVHQRNALAMTPILQLRPDAVPVEYRGKDVAVAARRDGLGRVVQVGYIDTWRWRLGGMNDAVTDFRRWWSAMASSVAYASRREQVVSASVEPTPMASLVSILGPPVVKKAALSPLDDPRLLPVLFGILMGSFLLEWSSRRLRGRP
jgi:hypothetical protein